METVTAAAVNDRAETEPLAVSRRLESRKEEWREQEKFAALLKVHLDPATTFSSGLENAPRTMKAAIFARLRGVRSGCPISFSCGVVGRLSSR